MGTAMLKELMYCAPRLRTAEQEEGKRFPAVKFSPNAVPMVHSFHVDPQNPVLEFMRCHCVPRIELYPLVVQTLPTLAGTSRPYIILCTCAYKLLSNLHNSNGKLFRSLSVNVKAFKFVRSGMC